MHGWHGRPALRGGLLAVLAAALFGASTPLVQRAGAGIGAFTTAALLYAGAALLGAALRRPVGQEARLRRSDLPRVLAMALAGAVVGPVALAWGLQHTSGTSASLLLSLEALFTAALATLFYREGMDRRLWTAMLLLLVGGVVLVLDRQHAAGESQLPGMLAVLLATAAWGFDNTLSRAVAERDPAQVVLAKAALGFPAALVLALGWREPVPQAWQVLALLAIGATGYGFSLRVYLLAQRAFGAARTASVFAFAPFVGAAVAMSLGEGMTWGTAAGGYVMLVGVTLHLYERHDHEHAHEPLEHEHAHRHDDGHHGHVHDPMPTGWHSHPHRHEAVRHEHPHVPDAHHTHRH